MTNEWKFEPIRGQVGQAIYAIGAEVMILALLAIRDHRRAGRLEARDRIANGVFVERFQGRITAVGFGECFDQTMRSWDAPDRLGRNGHAKVVARASIESLTGAASAVLQRFPEREVGNFPSLPGWSAMRDGLLQARADAIFRLVRAPK